MSTVATSFTDGLEAAITTQMTQCRC